jgi:hypothetical protein
MIFSIKNEVCEQGICSYLVEYTNATQFIDSFKNEAGNLEDFSHDGLTALFEYLDKVGAQVNGLKFDLIDIQNDFVEYPTATAAASAYGWTGCTLDTNQQEAQALEWLEQQTTVIPFNNGVIFKA